MKKSILLSAMISIFLVLSCISFSAVGSETVAPASKGDSPDLIIEITSATYKKHYFDIEVNISNIGTSAVPAGETLWVCVKVVSKITIDNETFNYLAYDKIFDLSDKIALESLEPGASINETFSVNNGTFLKPNSIIHVRVDPRYQDLDGDHLNGHIEESDEDNNTDQFVHRSPGPRIYNNPLLLRISEMFPRIFSLLLRILRL